MASSNIYSIYLKQIHKTFWEVHDDTVSNMARSYANYIRPVIKRVQRTRAMTSYGLVNLKYHTGI